MTRVLRIEDRQNSTSKGQEVADAVTVLECPPLKVHGVRLYQEGLDGKEVFTDILADDLDNDLERAINTPDDHDHNLEEAEEHLDDLTDIKLLVHATPGETTNNKKKPEVFELPVGGSVEDQYEYAQDKLGGEVSISDVFEDGQYLDVIGITKGKGIEGPVERHGVKPLGRKAQKISRKAGNLGPWHPDHTSWRAPQAGQSGNVRRTEQNKRLLQIGGEPEDINPEGGFTNYGEIRNDYILVKGSVPGPSQRLIMLRGAVRKDGYPSNPEITHIER